MKKAFAPVVPCPPEEPKAAVRRLFDQNGGIDRVAIKLGLQPPYVYSIAHPGTKDELTFARAAALTSSDAPAGAEYLALLAGGVFVPVSCKADDALMLTADAVRQHGEAMGAIVAGVQDGTLDAAEARTALVELDEAIGGLCSLRAHLMSIIRPSSDG